MYVFLDPALGGDAVYIFDNKQEADKFIKWYKQDLINEGMEDIVDDIEDINYWIKPIMTYEQAKKDYVEGD